MREAPPLENIPLFKRLTPEERKELAALMQPASFEPGETLFEEGRPEETLYTLTSGTVEVYKNVLSGRQQHLATMDAPTVVGEMGLLTDPWAAATVTARTRVEGHALPREGFLKLLDDGSPAAYKVVYEIGRTLAERMARTDASIAEIIPDLEYAAPEEPRDIEVFQDKLIREWSF